MSDDKTPGGYVYLYRRLWSHPVFKTRVEAAAFAWMVCAASWRPCRVRYKHLTLDLARGQVAISTRDLAEDWDWTDAKGRRFIAKLVDDGMITVSSNSGVMIITIVNYDAFQPTAGELEGTETEKKAAQHRRTYGVETGTPTDAPFDAANAAENKGVEADPHAPSGAPFGAGPTQLRSETDAQNKEGNKRKKDIRDSDGSARTDASAGTDRGTVPTPTEVEAERVVEAFHRIRDELWPSWPNFPSPRMILRGQAVAFLTEGATADLIIAVLDQKMRRAAADGKTATNSLTAFSYSITDAIADARKRASQLQRGSHDGTIPPRRSPTRASDVPDDDWRSAIASVAAERLGGFGTAPDDGYPEDPDFSPG